MRRLAPALLVPLAFIAPSSARAQANPNGPNAQTYTSSTLNGTSPNPVCQQQTTVGAVGGSPSASSTCTINSSTLNFSNAPFGAGTHTASATADLSSGLFSASSSVIGTLNPLADVQAQGLAYAWNYISISNPANVFRIVLSTSVSTSSFASSNPQDYAYGLGYVGAYSVTPSGTLTSLSQTQLQSGAGGYAQYNHQVSGCNRAGNCAQGTTNATGISTDLLGSDLNANGIFAEFIEAYSFDRAYDNGGSQITSNDHSSTSFLLPTITLYDANGNDITADHTITQDYSTQEVTSSPEPAGVVLMGTGLLALGVSTRRRRKA